MLSARSAARVDAVTGAVHAVGALARLLTRVQVITWEHVAVLLAYAAGAAVPPALYACCRGWYVRRRVAIVACIRVALALCLSVPLPIPDVEPSNALLFVWQLLISGHGLYAALLSIGMPLPLGVHTWVTALQATGQLYLASCRCGLVPRQPNQPGSLLTWRAIGSGTFQTMGAALDWPFHLVAPGVDMGFASERAACCACTAWIQLVLVVVLPTALLLASRGSSTSQGQQVGGSHPPAPSAAAAAAAAGESGQPGGSVGPAVAGPSRPKRAALRLLTWLDEAFCEQPLLMCVCAAEGCWLLLRASCGLALER